MQKPLLPKNEKLRQEALDSYDIVNSLPEQSFDDLTLIASQICDTPIAIISLIDNKRQWFKSKFGLEGSETHRDISFCGHAINEPNKTFEVTDAKKDVRFKDNPLVTGDLNVGFYAGVPLVDSSKFPLGTLCVIDQKERTLTEHQKKALEALSREVMNRIEVRKGILSQKKELEHNIIELEELQDNNYRYQSLIEFAPMGIVITDLQGKMVQTNMAFEKMMGHSKKELLEISVASLTHPDDMEETIKNLGKLKRGEIQHFTVEKRYFTKNKEIIWGRVSSSFVPDSSSKPAYLIGVLENITQQKKQDLEYASNMDRLDLAMKATNDGILDWTNVNSDELYWSPRFYEMLGYGEGELEQGMNVFMKTLVHPDDLEKTSKKINACLTEDVPFDLEFRLKTKSGEYKWCRGRGNGIKDSKGNSSRMAGSVSDITKLKEGEVRLIEQTKTLKTQNEDITQLAYVATHDLKSPMITIKGHFDYLKKQFKNPSEDISDSIEFIDEEIEKHAITLKGLTDAIRVKELKVEKEAIDLNRVVELAVLDFKNKVDNLDGQINLNLTKSAEVIGNLVYIQSIVKNLISNSLKYRSPSRKSIVTITTKVENKKITLSIEDNGLGIDLQLQKDKIFKMFNQFHNNSEGSGMGLYMVKNMVEKLEGTINVESKVDFGTMFNITLKKYK